MAIDDKLIKWSETPSFVLIMDQMLIRAAAYSAYTKFQIKRTRTNISSSWWVEMSLDYTYSAEIAWDPDSIVVSRFVLIERLHSTHNTHGNSPASKENGR